MSNTNFGFTDLRTAAELTLAPAKPLGRTPAPNLKFNAAAGTIGKITSAAALGGAAYNAFKQSFAAKDALLSLSKSITQSLLDFDTHAAAVLGGRTAIADAVFVASNVATSTSFTSAADLVQISGLKPGIVGTDQITSINSQLTQRKKQLQKMQQNFGRMQSAAADASGARITENFNRKPNPQPEEVDRPSFPRLAQGDVAAAADPVLRDKQRLVSIGNTIASGKPSFWNRVTNLKSLLKQPGFNSTLNMSFTDKARQAGWSEPASPFAAQFPFNKVLQTESGHIIEYDDTPGAERVHIFHRSGSFIEMHPNGQVVYKSMSHGYLVSLANQYVKVSGDAHIAVDGNASIYAKGKIDVQSDSDISIQTKKDFNVFAENVNLRAKKTAKLDGASIDLRYVKLPGSPVYTAQGPVPRLDYSALKVDFPKEYTIIDTANKQYITTLGAKKAAVLKKLGADLATSALLSTPIAPSAGTTKMAIDILNATKTTMDMMDMLTTGPKPKLTKIAFPSIPAASIPKPNPLGNPLIYNVKSQAAVTYRALQFDTPEETSAADMYQAHLDTRKALSDVPSTYVNIIPGAKSQPNTGIVAATTRPAVNYLDRNTFRGRYTFTPEQALANTTFTVRELVDSLAFPDISNFASAPDTDAAPLGHDVDGAPLV